MVDESLKPLSEAEIAEIDARYEPFPAFADWPQKAPSLESWDRAKEDLDGVAEDASPADISDSREIAMRAAAFDTGAIEGLYSTNRGLTFSVAEQSAAWEQEVDEQGSNTRALFEAQLHAFELVLDHVTKHVPQVTQVWLRRLHEEITTAQETYLVHTPIGSREQALPRGVYKRYPNHVRTAAGGTHAYAPVSDTQAEMDRLLRELETPEFQGAHPIVQASYAHYAFVAVHPFADGNGRVARALASVYTYRAASVPLLVLNEHRDAYFHSLAQADAGMHRVFVDFIADVGRETLGLTRDSLRTAMSPQPEAVLAKFDELAQIRSQAQRTSRALKEFGAWLRRATEAQIAELDVPGSVELRVSRVEPRRADRPKGFRLGANGVGVTFQAIAPTQIGIGRRIDIFVTDDPLKTPQVKLIVAEAGNEQLTLNLSDISPQLSAIAQHRLENLVRRTLGDGLEALHSKVLGRVGKEG
jgi:Fic family protein